MNRRRVPSRGGVMTARRAAGVLTAIAVGAVAACGVGTVTGGDARPVAPSPTGPASIAADCDSPTAVEVTDTGQLTAALAAATPGAVIRMAPGVYTGPFTAAAVAAADHPIALCGGRDTVLDGGPVDSGYTFHLDGASNWQLSGFTIRGGQKGLMADRAQSNLIEGLLIEGIGDEALHLRRGSSDNVVRGNEIHRTGLREAKYGEGIYIGSAESNWCEISACGPDRSDRNTIEDNIVSGTSAESVDIKEGTTGGLLRGNSFAGDGMTEGDSWVDVKGNGWTIADNTGVDTPEDGFQVHQILDGWGVDNTFSGNTSTVNGDGYAINITKNREQNHVSCSNTGAGAAKGLSTVDCT